VSGRITLWLLACLVAVGCASSEGGVTGTGITAISGNIVLVSNQAAPDGSGALPFPIRVSIAEVPGIDSTTDADGTFQLSGDFSGSLTLQFANANDGTSLGPLALEIPVGSQTVLENIEIHTDASPADRVQPAAVRQFDVVGRVDMIECSGDGSGVALITDGNRPGRQLLVNLTPDTDIETRDGTALACGDLTKGAVVGAEGFVRREDQTLVASVVVVAPPPSPGPGPQPRPERLRGKVDGVACMRGLIEIEQQSAADILHRIVRVTDSTEFLCESPLSGACDCSAIAVGAHISVAGLIFPDRPGQISAELIAIGTTSVPVVTVGPIVHVACTADGLSVQDETTGLTVRVVLTSDTEIRCRGDLPCRCADLHARERVRVAGVRPGGGGPLTADRITVLPRRQS
jgi:hypothetical protein